MGLDAWLTVVPRTQFRKWRRNPASSEPETLVKFELYRNWFELDAALDLLGQPLSLAVRGDRPDVEWGESPYSAFVTPVLVKRISKALNTLSDGKLIAALTTCGFKLRKYEHVYYTGALKELKAAYRMAARQDAYVLILIC